MRAVQFHESGPPSVLSVVDVAEPVCGPGEVKVAVKAAAVNHIDLDIRSGLSRFPVRTPFQLGRESAGSVVEVGADVVGRAVGDRVIVSAYPPCWGCQNCEEGRVNLCDHPRRPGIDVPGGYAEYVTAPACGVIGIPDRLAFETAACVQLAFGTAWHALIGRGRLRAGETVLIVGAAGGTGSAAVQIAALAGARVVAAVGSSAKAEYLRDLGVEIVVDYSTGSITDLVEKRLGTRCLDVALDGVGGDMFKGVLPLLRPGGRLVQYGAHGGEHVSFDLIAFFRSYTSLIASRGWVMDDMRAVMRGLEQGRLRPLPNAVFPLADVAKAHQSLEARSIIGKIVLVPHPAPAPDVGSGATTGGVPT